MAPDDLDIRHNKCQLDVVMHRLTFAKPGGV